MRAETKTTLSFGEFEIDRERRLLLKKGETVNLNPKTFDLLLVLIAHRGEILSKNELLDKVWENQFVEENNLTVHVAALRKALGEKKNEHRFIVTVPGKGYSFVAALDDQPGEIIVETHKFERIVVEEEIEDETVEAETPTARRLNRAEIPRAVKSVSAPAFISVACTGFFALMLGFWFWNGEKQPPKQIELTKLTSNGKVSNATITPDGKYAVFAQTEIEGESLRLRQKDDFAGIRAANFSPPFIIPRMKPNWRFCRPAAKRRKYQAWKKARLNGLNGRKTTDNFWFRNRIRLTILS